MIEFLSIAAVGVLRGAIVLAAALVLASLASRRSASVQHALLTAGLIAQLGIPALAVLGSNRLGDLVPRRAASVVATVEAPLRTMLNNVSTTAPATASYVLTETRRPQRFLVVIWLLGTTTLALWMIFGRVYLRRLTRDMRPVRSGRVFAELSAMLDMARVRQPVTLFVGGPFFVPLTWGSIFPVILMPGDSGEWPAETLRLAIVHEVAHLRRRDPVIQGLSWATIAAVWFNPLVWMAARRLRLAAERAADDAVLESGLEPSRYVDALVAMIKNAGAEPVALRVSFAMARRAEFETRMLAVLNERASRGAVRSAPLCAGALALAAIVLVAATAPVQDSQITPSMTASERRSEASVWIAAARQAPGDPGSLENLEKATAQAMTGAEIDSYLTVVAGMRQTVATSQAIAELVEHHGLDETQTGRALQLLQHVVRPVPRSLAMIAIARSGGLTREQRKIYLDLTSGLSGPPLAEALRALP